MLDDFGKSTFATKKKDSLYKGEGVKSEGTCQGDSKRRDVVIKVG